jgi:membrane-bound serine protease (ClpP class)
MYSRHAHRRSGVRRLVVPAIIGIAILVALSLTASSVQAESAHVDVIVLNSDIGPGSLHFLTQAIDTAEHDGAQALVMQIDTPGGDIDSMESMMQAEVSSTVPIIAYVSPSGGRAASAGAFVTLAAHIAAMAPTTRIGASSPIDASGADLGTTLKSKIENDLIASITGIQKRYGRNVPLAVKMVTQASSYDDTQAVSNRIVDLEAPSLNALLTGVNGRTVPLNGGRTVTLQTAGVSVQTIDPTAADAIYSFLIDPNVAFLLFVVALIGIYLEIAHPGVIVPGVVGGLALLLFLFAAGSLSPDWVGLALMAFALVLLVLDVRVPTHGVLTIGAVIALVLGSLLFFNSGSGGPYSEPRVNPLIVYAMGGVVGLIGLSLVSFIVRAQRLPVTTGVESMIGSRVTALTELDPEGRVSYGGENWAAVLDPPAISADAGAILQIVSVEGLRLHVRPIHTRPIVYPQSATTLE